MDLDKLYAIVKVMEKDVPDKVTIIGLQIARYGDSNFLQLSKYQHIELGNFKEELALYLAGAYDQVSVICYSLTNFMDCANISIKSNIRWRSGETTALSESSWPLPVPPFNINYRVYEEGDLNVIKMSYGGTRSFLTYLKENINTHL